jgi:hypothetical protein
VSRRLGKALQQLALLLVWLSEQMSLLAIVWALAREQSLVQLSAHWSAVQKAALLGVRSVWGRVHAMAHWCWVEGLLVPQSELQSELVRASP